VNGAPDFGQQPAVINGASQLLIDLFGEDGRHARSAIGAGSLPMGISCEIEAIFELKE
jgi:enamine deaminase RidA (YjgF/YER057c/UK114 family)